MAIGTRPIGTRSLGDSAGEAMPRIYYSKVIYLVAMPGAYTPGGGTGAPPPVSSGPTDVSSSDAGVGTEGQSLIVNRTITESGAGVEAQSLSVLLPGTDTGAGGEAHSLSVTLGSTDAVVATEGESLFIPAPVTTHAFASIFANYVLEPAVVSAYATLFKNIVDQIPTPHIWYVVPPGANRGETVTVVGAGFGVSATEFEGMVTLNSMLLAVEDWRRIVPTPDALTLDRIINSSNDTTDPEHDRIDFKIPHNATSGDVKVVLNAEGV